MNELSIFNYGQNEVRTVQVDGEPWFVAKDVASILGYSNPQKAVRDQQCPVRKLLAKRIGKK